jgi:endo-1,4-beta-xylanase
MKRKLAGFIRCAVLVLVLVLSVGCFPMVTTKPDDGKAPGIPSLREIYQDYFEIGAAVSIAGWSSKTIDTHQDLIKKHFSSLTAENEMKPDALQPRQGQFNFSDGDKMVDFALSNGMKVRGHTLVWHAQTPDWFFRDKDGNRIDQKAVITEEDRQLVIERLENHIETVMKHYAGKVYAWDVVNEAISDDGRYILRQDSPWFRILGENFIEIAFRKAHEVDPDAKLFYNDYNAVMVYKRGRMAQMLKGLLDKGVPVHGVGIQGHWGVNGPAIDEIEDALKMYADLGLEIHITELDIGMDDKSLAEQAERYREVFALFKKYSHAITSVTLWGISDAATWRQDDNPLLFDKNQEPKPAFWAIVDTDKSWEQNRAYYLGL